MKNYSKFIYVLLLAVFITAISATHAQESTNVNTSEATPGKVTEGSAPAIPTTILEEAGEIEEQTVDDEKNEAVIRETQGSTLPSGGVVQVSPGKSISELKKEVSSLRNLVGVLYILVSVLLLHQALLYIRRRLL